MDSDVEPSLPQVPTLNFDDDDKLNRKKCAEYLEKFIAYEHAIIDGSLVVTLEGPFGSGKTKFLRMWETRLTNLRESGKSEVFPITINAWEDDFCGNPLVSLIGGIEEAVRKFGGEARRKEMWELTKELAKFTGILANDALAHATGADFIKANEESEDVRLDASFHRRKDAMRDLKKLLQATFSSTQPHAVVMIDELDRCRPDYAIHYLEVIKHIFDVRGLVFVLAIDARHLESSAKALFGNLNFPEYLRKFVHRRAMLPRIKSFDVAQFINYCKAKYFQPSGDANGGNSSIWADVPDFHFEHWIIALDMQPRQIEEAFRIAGHLTAGSNENLISDITASRIILMAFLAVAAEEKFDLFGNYRADAQPSDLPTPDLNEPDFSGIQEDVVPFHWIAKIMPENKIMYWISLIYGGFVCKDSDRLERQILEAFVAMNWLKPSQRQTQLEHLVNYGAGDLSKIHLRIISLMDMMAIVDKKIPHHPR